MKAKFIGVSSRGFHTGKVYEIRSKLGNAMIGGKEVMFILIQDTATEAWRPYASLESVLENWQFMN